MQIQDMPKTVWALVILGFFLGIGAIVLTELQSGFTASGHSYNATGNALTGIGNTAKQLPTVGTIFGVLLIVGAVVMLFFYFRGRNQY